MLQRTEAEKKSTRKKKRRKQWIDRENEISALILKSHQPGKCSLKIADPETTPAVVIPILLMA